MVGKLRASKISAVQNKKSVTSTFSGFGNVYFFIVSNHLPFISPEDLFVQLLQIETIAKFGTALLAFFESKAVFQPECVSQALQKILKM